MAIDPTIPISEAGRIRELLGLYQAAQVEITKELRKAALTPFRRFRLREQLRQVEAVTAALQVSAVTASEAIIAANYKTGADISSLALNAQGVSTAPINMGNRINTASVQVIADQMALELGIAADQVRRQASSILRQTQQKVISETQINRLIGQGIVRGETRRETSRALTKVITDQIGDGIRVQAGSRTFDPKYYAELVTRTRTREAMTEGAIQRGLEYDVTLYQVSVHACDCDECLLYQGKIYSVVPDARFPLLEERPPYHPNCLLEETPVFAPGKRAAFVATYNGPVVDIALSNSARFSTTMNHVFLTPSGFAFAKDLREGDKILCSALFEDVVLRNPDNDKTPSTIKDEVRTFSESLGGSSSSVPATAKDLHGDGRFVDGNINIVRADGLLSRDAETAIPEPPSERDFERRDVGLFGLVGCRDTAAMLMALGGAPDGIVGRARDRLASLWPEFRHAEPHNLTSGTPLDSALHEKPINDTLIDVKFSHEFSDALPGDVAAANLGSREQRAGALAGRNSAPLESTVNARNEYIKLLGNFLAAHPGDIRIAHVTSHGVRQFSGHVYDLQTVSSLYLCNGALSSNCKHVLIAFVPIPGEEDELDAMSALSSKRGPIATDHAGFVQATDAARKRARKSFVSKAQNMTVPELRALVTYPNAKRFGTRDALLALVVGGNLAAIRRAKAEINRKAAEARG